MIKHDGEQVPVAWNTVVRVRFRNGETDEGIANDFAWKWRHDWTDLYDIVEYEVLSETKSEREVIEESEREVLVVYSLQDYVIYSESEFLSMLPTEYNSPEDFFDSSTAFIIKDGKFHELTEEDIEMSPRLKA